MVSIILPNYNHAKFLKERLYSVFNQTYKMFEVIILDDCSTDDSVAILNEFKDHPKVSHYILNKKNTGSPFLQWKKGIDLAVGKYIWIAESDDSCNLDFLEKQIQLLEEKNGEVTVAETIKFNSKGKNGVVNHPIFRESKCYSELNENQFLYCPVLNVSSLVFLRENALKAKKFVNFRLIGDRVFYQEAFHLKKFYLNKDTKSFFRKEGDSVSSLSYKDINYYDLYFREHFRFAKIFYKTQSISKEMFCKYITRFYKRVRDRLSKRQKLTFIYFKIFMYYQFKRFVL